MGHEGMNDQSDKKPGNVRASFVLIAVVLLILTFLGSIGGPHGHSRPRQTKALAEIRVIELALTDMLVHADRTNLHDFFNPSGMQAFLGFDPVSNAQMTKEQFELVEQVYTRTLYALLTVGRSTLEREYQADDLNLEFRKILNVDLVNKIGTSYLADLGKDPWGELYRIWPGPWPHTEDAPPIPFRFYRSAQNVGLRETPVRIDQWVINTNGKQEVQLPNTGEYEPFGFPAPKNELVYIYSTGADRTSGQAIFGGPLEPTNYAPEDPTQWGGGDDINSWDKDLSWMILY